MGRRKGALFEYLATAGTTSHEDVAVVCGADGEGLQRVCGALRTQRAPVQKQKKQYKNNLSQ